MGGLRIKASGFVRRQEAVAHGSGPVGNGDAGEAQGEPAVPRTAVHEKASIRAVGGELAGEAPRADRPSAADLPAQILETRDPKARLPRQLAVVAFRSHAREAALAADRLQETPDLPVPRALTGEPGQNAEAPARPQGAEGLAEEALLVDHVLGALNCVYPVEDRVLEPVREPIPTRDGDPFMAGRGHAGPLSLNRRDRHARHEDAMLLGEIYRGGAVSTAYVASALSLGEPQPLREEVDQCLHGPLRRLAPGRPVAVMDVTSPDLPVERVELVVVGRHRRGG